MAFESVDNRLVTQFNAMIHNVAQQTQARFRPWAEEMEFKGDNMAYDSLGDIEARELTGRFNKVVFDDIEFQRRKITKRRFGVTLPVDKYDLEGMMTDPKGALATAALRAMERQYDRVFYDCLGADIQTGREFGTTVTAAADGVLTVNATAGVTLAKLLEVRQNFIDNEVGNDLPVDFGLAISGDEHTALLGILQLTSQDYSRDFVLEKGSIGRAAGLNLIAFGASARNPILQVAGGVRTSYAFAKGAVAMAIARNWEVNVEKRNDIYDTWQVQVVGVLGGVRIEGKLVQKFTSTDS